jgi:hypothetical protein
MGNQQSSQAAINYWNSGGYHHHHHPNDSFYLSGDQEQDSEQIKYYNHEHRGSVTSFQSSNYDSALEEFSPQSRRTSILVENTPSQLSAYTKYLHMNNLVNTFPVTTTTIPQNIFTFDTLSPLITNKENLAPLPRQLSKSIEINKQFLQRRLDTETASESSSGYNTLSNSSSKTSAIIEEYHVCCCDKCWCKKKKRKIARIMTATTTDISSSSSDDEAQDTFHDSHDDESVFETDKNNNVVFDDKVKKKSVCLYNKKKLYI